MKFNHKLIHKSELARSIGMSTDMFNNRLRNHVKPCFTDEELAKIKEALEDLFCYCFEVDELN